MKIRNTKLSVVFLLLLFFCSCGTILRGKRQIIGISSSPDGATIIINGKVHKTIISEGKVMKVMHEECRTIWCAGDHAEDDDEIIVGGKKQPSKTPVTINLKRKKNYIIQVKKEGYIPESRTITRKTSPWIIGNILFGGIIGLVVDFRMGGAYNLNPENLHFNLKPIPAPTPLEKEPAPSNKPK